MYKFPHSNSDVLVSTRNTACDASQEMLGRVRRVFEHSRIASTYNQSNALHYLEQVVRAQAMHLVLENSFLVLRIDFLVAIILALLPKRRRPGA